MENENPNDLLIKIEKRYHRIYDESTRLSRFPKSEHKGIDFVNGDHWVSGFFAGCLYYLYQISGKPIWNQRFHNHIESLRPVQYHTTSHDVGFIIASSFGKLDQSTHDQVIINAANSLATRFNNSSSTFTAWDHASFRNPLIIDNLMNLEIIYLSLRIQPDSSLEEMTKQHIEQTITHLSREDNTWFHIAEFDDEGNFIGHRAGQGASIRSVWTRGQIWAIYGMTMAHEFFKEPRYLELAKSTADILIVSLENDHVLNWDLGSSTKQTDISSMTAFSAALMRLYENTGDEKYLDTATELMIYLTNNHIFVDTEYFIFSNSVGNMPNDVDVGVPLIYADYYYMEALLMLLKLQIDVLKF